MKNEKDIILSHLSKIMDPEVPALTIMDLGIVRDVEISEGHVEVSITPTYSGCPAMKAIENEIISRLREKGFDDVTVKTVYSPVWTTDWLSEDARHKLKDYGIAPPAKNGDEEFIPLMINNETVSCPYCDSSDTVLRSRFGSTACKSLYFCNSCKEPFEYFKRF
ncbi:MAG: phenylacetate-CoA oxygenase subunit PaaJ [Ignavibacteria bacterium]|jgi:ring-1,2-phenylacetyl-CoA epoxidase subunit PaaD|nr:phenylacetate-CoA oxygenase subunit PaaJ [Ignavibacteria bacterium]MCU7503285.1 phenylacetate-CoA oxygenase subunit PaaJ [Ignavibacteria bacterium]MCU7515769.1 phenylacetate-CoA oxygenase subunit PaaJ [Ignavibacteria bacterium]